MRRYLCRLAGRSLLLVTLALAPARSIEVELVSRRMTNAPTPLGDTVGVELSADGNWAALTVSADHPTQLTYSLDVILRKLSTGRDALVSRSLTGTRGNGPSAAFGVSADSGIVVFQSEASDLVRGDDNEASDVFIFYECSGQIVAVSRTDAAFGNGDSYPLAISADARFVVFESEADNLVANDRNGAADIFLFDRTVGTIKLVTQSYLDGGSAPGAIPGEALEASVSADGRYVAFVSSATNLVRFTPALADGQVYLRDMQLATNRWLNRTWDGKGGRLASNPTISANGEVVAFVSADLVIGPAEYLPSTYLYYYLPKNPRLVIASEPAVLGNPVVHNVREFDMTPDGRWMVALAEYQMSVSGPSGWALEIFDTVAFTNGLVSLTGAGDRPRGSFQNASLSDDGRFLFFTSDSPDLPGALANASQLYKHDLAAGVTTPVSTQIAGRPAHDVHDPVLSGDATRIVYLSGYSDPPGEKSSRESAFLLNASAGGEPLELFVADPRGARSTGTGASSVPQVDYFRPPPQSLLSADGRIAVFMSSANDLAAGDSGGGDDIFVRNLDRRETRRVSAPVVSDRAASPFLIGMSSDGERVVWHTGPTLANNVQKRGTLFVYSTRTGTHLPASVLPDGTISENVAIGGSSFDLSGRFLLFWDLPSATNSITYLRDLNQGATRVVPYSPRHANRVLSPAVRYLIDYSASAPPSSFTWIYDLQQGTTNSLQKAEYIGASLDDTKMLFLRATSLSLGTLFLYDPGANSARTIATNASLAAISGNGSTVVYRQSDGSGGERSYFYDVARDTHTPLRLGPNGPEARVVRRPALSYDGRMAAFAARGAQDAIHLYVLDRALQTFDVVNGANGLPADLISGEPWISADGHTVLFESLSPDLAANDWNLATDTFVARLPKPLRATREFKLVRIDWHKSSGARLQYSTAPNGPWITIETAQDPYWDTAQGAPARFYRLLHP